MIRLTVICITYNHVRFLRRALDGFVNQKTDFEFEVLLHDDADVGYAGIAHGRKGKVDKPIPAANR